MIGELTGGEETQESRAVEDGGMYSDHDFGAQQP